MSNNNVNTLCRIDQAIRGLNDDGTDDSYVPAQSANGALERIEKSIKELDIKGIKSGLPKVTNKDNGKILQVINGKWGKGDKPSESIYANDFAEHFDEYALKDVVYFVDGTVEPYTRFNESIDSQEAAQNKVYAGPVNPSVVIIGYEPWHAFSDNAEHGFSTVYDESDGSYLQYVFEYPQHVRAISFKLKYETNLDEPPTIPVELYIELHDGHKGWKDRTLIFRGSIDEDFEFMWYAPTSNPLSITDSIRFINTSPLSDNLTYVVSIANIQLFDASSELYTGDKSIWYKGTCFGNIGQADNQNYIIEGTKNQEGTTVTLSKSYSEIKALIESGNIPIITVTDLPSAGKNYYVLYSKYDGSTVSKQVNFIYSGTDCRYNPITNKLEIKNVRLALNETENNVARVINDSEEVDNIAGPTRTVLFEASDGGGVWMDSQNKTFDLNDDIDNYDEIQIIALTTEGDNDYHYTGVQTFMTEDMLVPAKSDASKGMAIEVMTDRSTGIDTSVLRVVLVSQSASETSKRTMWCSGARGLYGGVAIHKVIGIKY